MKTIITSAIIASFICGGVLTASAQNQEAIDYMARNTDLSALTKLEEQFGKEFQENYQKALVLARENGWPLTINKPDGGFSELKGVTADGQPLYLTTSNQGSAKTSRVNKIQPGGTAGLNLDGAGMLAAVWDAGKPRTDHVDLTGRITAGDNSFASFQEHSTHVMGTVIGSGANRIQARGMAYNANAIWADWTNDKAEMTAAVKNKGLLVSNHSYGLVAGNVPKYYFGAYIQDSSDADKLLFDAPFYQPVWAAGNDRDSYLTYNSGKKGHDLLTGEACSKNVVVVAAVNEVASYTGASSVVMSSFSNWGPTDDNRIKPDISDKGVGVLSTVETSTTAYATLNGTSMASPGVAGALVLIQQHYWNLNKPAFMRSATLRGLLTHTADEAGTTAGPDSRFGWGLINAEKMAKTITDSKVQKSIINELSLSQGGTYTTTVQATGSEALVVTLSWTDKAGPINGGTVDGATKILVNDLDVRVTKDGVSSYPWKLAGISNLDAAAIKGDNAVDNIEKIEVANTVAGTYTIKVTHKGTLVRDNLPIGAAAYQDFSLIVTGIDQTLAVEHSDFNEFNVWPNPADNLLNVSIQSDLSEDAFVTLYDVQGRRVIDQKLDASNAIFQGTVSIDSLTPGIYLVKVSQAGKQSVRKIIKK